MPQKSADKRKAYMTRYNEENRERLLAQKKLHYRANAEKYKARAKANREKDVAADRARNRKRYDESRREAQLAYRRLKKTGFTPAMVADLMFLQDSRCAVCKREFVKTPCADHDHETKAPRGLLCDECNMIEGRIKSLGLSPETFAALLTAYLRNPPAHIFKLA